MCRLNLSSEIKLGFGKSQYVIPFRFAPRHYIDTFLIDLGVLKWLKGSALKHKINVSIFNKEVIDQLSSIPAIVI